MSLAKRLWIAPFVVFGLVACGDVVGSPITNQSNAQSGKDSGTPSACTPPEPALACNGTTGCSNYPNTVCQQGYCVCPGTDAGSPHQADASAPSPSCTPPQPALSCQQTG